MFLLSPTFKRVFHILPTWVYLPIPFGKMRGIFWIPKAANPGQAFGRYESEQEKVLSDLLKDATVFWDVGAHVGWYSILASKIMPNGKIYCFEPNPNNLKYLKRHVEINNINNINIFPSALGSKNGESFFSGERQQGSLTTTGDLVVQIATADKIIKTEKIIPDLIKIDIEGAEVDFLEGAKHLLSAHQPTLLLSLHGYKKRDVCEEILVKNGYKIELLVSNKEEGDYVFLATKGK